MKKLIPSLNGLRALSIIGVLISHIQLKSLNMGEGVGGQFGVNVFFIISGFLITLLLIEEETKTGTISIKSFFVRRSLRIFPVFYSLLLVYLLLQISGVLVISNWSWFSSITYTKYIFPQGQDDWETGHLWSLSVEEHFYLLWPFIFLYGRSIRKQFTLLVILIVPLVRLFSGFSFMHLFTRADALMIGCLFALYYPQIREFFLNRKYVVTITSLIVLVFCLFSRKILQTGYDGFMYHITLALFGSFGTITNICVASIMVISINFKQNFFFTFLNWAPVDFLGKLSYSIYIWQQLFFSERMGSWSSYPINLVYIFIASICSYYLIEQPFLRLKKYFSKS